MMTNLQSARISALFRFSIVAVVAISIASCAMLTQDKVPGLKNAIVGKWKEIHGPRTVQFFKEGTVIFAGGEKTETAYYKLLDDRQIRIEPKFNSKVGRDDSRIIQFSIHRDQLTINEGQKTTKYQKQK